MSSGPPPSGPPGSAPHPSAAELRLRSRVALRPGDAIRPATPADLPLLAPIERAAAARFADLGIQGEFLERTVAPDELAKAAREGRLWVALSGGDCVGFALADRREDGRAWLEEMDVHPDCGRRGLGRALLGEVLAWARLAGAEALSLTTFRDVPWNAPFYAAVGFHEVPASHLSSSERAALEAEEAGGLPMGRRLVMRMDLRADEDS
jgi:GNAT superfamily N-acetyltransferase